MDRDDSLTAPQNSPETDAIGGLPPHVELQLVRAIRAFGSVHRFAVYPPVMAERLGLPAGLEGVTLVFLFGDVPAPALAPPIDTAVQLWTNPEPREKSVLGWLDAGWTPEYGATLEDFGLEAVVLRRVPASAELRAIVARFEAEIAGRNRTRAELQRRLDLAHTQIEDIQARVEESTAKYRDATRKARERKTKIEDLRRRCLALEGSLNYRLGGALLLPARKAAALARRLRTSAKKRLTGPVSPYQVWLDTIRPSDPVSAGYEWTARTKDAAPLFSIRVHITGGPAKRVRAMLLSLQDQWYPHWELCLQGDPSAVPEECRKLLKRARDHDPRIRWGEPKGEYVATLGQYDLLDPATLAAAAHALRENPETGVVYFDHDELAVDGTLDRPFLKPDWSPDLLTTGNYLGRCTFVRQDLVKPGCSAYDTVLRATEQTDRIFHVPLPFVHVAVDDVPDPAGELEALRSAIGRRGMRGNVEVCGEVFRVRRDLVAPKKIAILIPTRDRLELLSRCIESIEQRTDYPDYEIIVIDNDSREPATLEYYKRMPHRLVSYPGQFNFSAMNNYAVSQTDAEWLLFLNNDMEVLDAGWLRALAEHVQRPEVGAVGAKLIYENNTIQHAGVVIGLNKIAEHAFRGLRRDEPGVHWQAQRIRNYSAVTGACLMARREVFLKAGGFDEKAFGVNFNDVDLCLKMRERGYLVVYTPYAELYHYESASRGRRYDNMNENRAFRDKWGAVMANDPCYNPHLSRTRQDFHWREPGETEAAT